MKTQKIKQRDPMRVINIANDLSAYTLRLLCNEDLFPKRSRWLLAGSMADIVNQFHTFIHTANEIKVTAKEEAEDRHRYQTLALSSLQALEEKMELAKIVLDLNVDRLEYWAGLWNEEDKLLRNWISKDTKRYASI